MLFTLRLQRLVKHRRRFSVCSHGLHRLEPSCALLQPNRRPYNHSGVWKSWSKLTSGITEQLTAGPHRILGKLNPKSNGWGPIEALTQVFIRCVAKGLAARQRNLIPKRSGEQGRTGWSRFCQRVELALKTRKENGDPAYEGVHHRTGRKDL